MATETAETHEITLGEIAQGSPESLLYVLNRQLDMLTGTRRLAVVAQLRALVEYAEASPLQAEARVAREALLANLLGTRFESRVGVSDD